MNHTFTEKYIAEAKAKSLMRSIDMKNEAGGDTLESLAEAAYRTYLIGLDKDIKAQGGGKITLTLRDVFIAGYRMAEERDWK